MSPERATIIIWFILCALAAAVGYARGYESGYTDSLCDLGVNKLIEIQSVD